MSTRFFGDVKAGSTSVSVGVKLLKTADGTALTGKVAADCTAAYWRQGAAAVTITLADLSLITSAWSSGGLKEVDATKKPGSYRLDVPDAAFLTGADWVEVEILNGATGFAVERFALEASGADDTFTRVGAAGAGLTALGDTRVANLDAAVSSRGTSTYAGGDTSGTTTLLTRVPGVVQPQTGDSFARLGAPALASLAADVAAVKALLSIFDGGAVSASPAPTTTGFTLTGATLQATSGFYTTPTAMVMVGTSGANLGRSNTVLAHAVSGSNHAFTFASAWPVLPVAGNTFILVG